VVVRLALFAAVFWASALRHSAGMCVCASAATAACLEFAARAIAACSAASAGPLSLAKSGALRRAIAS
jgi:hypothetical protein